MCQYHDYQAFWLVSEGLCSSCRTNWCQLHRLHLDDIKPVFSRTTNWESDVHPSFKSQITLLSMSPLLSFPEFSNFEAHYHFPMSLKTRKHSLRFNERYLKAEREAPFNFESALLVRILPGLLESTTWSLSAGHAMILVERLPNLKSDIYMLFEFPPRNSNSRRQHAEAWFWACEFSSGTHFVSTLDSKPSEDCLAKVNVHWGGRILIKLIVMKY